MPSTQSFWVDEAVDAMYAMQGSFEELITLLSIDPKSQAQMPLGMLTIWAWAKCFGTSEFALRSINMVWVALSLFLLIRIGKQTGSRMLWLAILVHPFIWYYANEARPYAMQIALGTWVIERMIHAINQQQPQAIIGLLIASVPFAATSIIHYIPLSIIAIVITAYAWPVWRQHLGQVIKYGLFACLVHLPLVIYYLSTLTRGVGGQKGGTDSVGITTLGFTAYEISGIFAFGPDRQEIRERSLESGLPAVLEIFSPFWPLLLFICLITTFVFVIGFRQLMGKPAARIFWACAIIFTGTVLITAIAASLKHSVLWARHLSGVFPCLLLLLALPIAQLFAASTSPKNNSSEMLKLLAMLCIAAFLGASFRVRFATAFSKVDNRSAAHFAIANLDQYRTVFWPGIDRAGIHDLLQHPTLTKGKLITRPEIVLNDQVLPDVAIIGRVGAEIPRIKIYSQLERAGLRPRTTGNPRGLEIWEY
jgi:hypothetical protein